MPEWLLKEENYTVKSDRDTFINKSILSLLHIISLIRAGNVTKTNKLYINSAVKVVFTIMLVVLLSISRSATFVVIINVYLLATLIFMDGKDIIKILSISLTMTVFTFAILIPSVLLGNSYSIVTITLKVFASVTAVNMLSRTTRLNSITSALKSFFIPDIFIFVLDITIKYIVMLGEFSLNMLYALKLRSVGRNKSKYTSLSGIAGTMFLKSLKMSEDMFFAMECRGFNGEYRVYSKFKLTFADFLYISFNLFVVFAFIYFKQ